jgi:hypothetical protein
MVGRANVTLLPDVLRRRATAVEECHLQTMHRSKEHHVRGGSIGIPARDHAVRPLGHACSHAATAEVPHKPDGIAGPP